MFSKLSLNRRRRSGFCSMIAVAGIVVASQSGSTAWAQTPPKKAAPVENMTVLTKDGASLHCTYFPSAAGRNAPVVVMLHGKGGNRLAWQAPVGKGPSLAQALQANDFAVICLDLRLHGENIAAGANGKSKTTNVAPRDYQAMVALDLEAVKKFIFDQHQKQALNMNKLAIVAVDFSASVAMLYTDLDWSKEPYDDAALPAQRTPKGKDVRALVLISPDTKVPGLNISNAATLIRNLQMPVMIGVGKKDNQDKLSAKKLSEQLMPKKEEKPHVVFHEYDSNARGTDLLGKNVGVEAHIYSFLDEHVKKTEGEWRDRKSPLTD